MSKKIGKRAIESRIKSAFYNVSDDIDNRILRSAMLSLSDSPSIEKDKVRVMTKRKNHTSILKSVAIAAAMMLILSITVTAASLSGLASKEDAFSAAISYTIKNETDAALREELSFAAAILGDVYLEGISEGRASLGLSEGRLVYNVYFYAVGYKFYCTVDAKSLVVLDSSKTYAPDYVPKNNSTLKALKKNQSKGNAENQSSNQHNISQRSAKNIFTDNFGLHSSLIVNMNDKTDRGVIITETNDGKYYVTRRCDGYSYSCNIDCETGEITDANVAALENYKGEAVLHEKIEGLIGIEEATKLAIEISNADAEKTWFPAELFNISYFSPGAFDIDVDYMYYITTVISEERVCDMIINAVTGEAISKDEKISTEFAHDIAMKELGITLGEEFGPLDSREERGYGGKDTGGRISYYAGDEENISGVDEYQFRFYRRTLGIINDIIIDMHTGEVLDVKTYDIASGDNVENEDDEISEAVDGLISKPTAIAIALENSGLTINDTSNGAPSIVLSEQQGRIVYIVKWKTLWKTLFDITETSRSSNFECVVDGISGEVISSTPEVIRPNIEAESSKGSYIGKKAAEDVLIEDVMLDRESVNIISNDIEQYCVSASEEAVEFRAVYAINFDRKRVGADHETAYVDALSGEVLNYQIWVN